MAPERPSSDFGARLRAARERRGISLRQIAAATKIPIASLEALERNEMSRLPGGLFSRAFVRSYASEVGLNPEATLQDFIAEFQQETVVTGHTPSERAADNIKADESDRRMSTAFVGLLVVCVPLAGAVVYFGTTASRTAPAATATVAPDPTPAPPPSVTPPSSVPSRPERPMPASPPEVVAASESPATPAADDSFTVGLSVKRPCWVSATVDGHIAIERLLEPGDLRKIEVRREMVLTAGDAAAVTLTLNGAEAKALGKSGEVVTKRLNLANFKGYVQSR
jgi:cytoskeleton protein RodZ